MQRYTLICLTAFVVLGVSCTSTPKKEAPTYVPVIIPKEAAPKALGYYCPMKCEGEKVYPNDGKPCPVCDMKLIPTGKASE